MVTVTYTTENGGSVVFNAEDGINASYGGEPDGLNECPTDFRANVRLEDGRTVFIYVRRGNQAHSVEPIVLVELHQEGKISGPEIFRRWLGQKDLVDGNAS